MNQSVKDFLFFRTFISLLILKEFPYNRLREFYFCLVVFYPYFLWDR